MITDPNWQREVAYPGLVQQGDKGPAVKRVQEWLVLGGKNITIDGDFGPATAAALGAKLVNETKWATLVAPMANLTVDTVRGWLSPTSALPTIREVGGANAGPWVRLFMDGHEGPDWPWCAGFATWVRKTLSASLLNTRTFSCDVLWANAKQSHVPALIRPAAGDARVLVKPGNLFMLTNPSNRSDHTHVGFVTAVSSDGATISTLEGNTNDEGSREGYEVCRRTRSVTSLDFILVSTP